MRQACEEDRTRDDARRHDARIAGGEARLNLVENRAVDDRRNPDLDNFTFRLNPAGFGLSPIEAPAANVNGIGQKFCELDATPKRRPSRVRTPRAFSALVTSLTPIGPWPSPSR